MSNYGKGNPHSNKGLSTTAKKTKGWKWAGIMPLPRKGHK